jgi:beta-glucosidase
MRHLLTAHTAAYSIINAHAHCVSHSEGAQAHSPKPLIGIAHNMMPVAPARRRYLDRMVAGIQDRAWNASLIEALATGRMSGLFGDGRPVQGLAGSYTYIGVNYYLRRTVAFRLNGIANGFSEDVFPPSAPRTDFGWPIVPEGLYDSIMQASSLDVPIYITENGIADARDTMRPRYIVDHLAQTRRAIDAGADVRGYFHWTFQDNFEWRDGYTQKFGLYALDPEDPQLTRVPRPSAGLYAAIAQANGVTQIAMHQPRAGTVDM